VTPESAEQVEALATRAAAGDSQALDRLLLLIQPDVVARCHRMLPDRSDAEEAAQDVLLAVSRRIAKFEGRSKFTTWLYRVVSNTVIDTYRRLKQASERLDDLAEMESLSRTSVIAGTRIDLLEALEQIDRRVGEPVVLRDIYGLDYQEISELMDCPVGTVKSRIHEGRNAIKVLLQT